MKDDNLWKEKLKESYKENKGLYKKLCKELAVQIDELLSTEKISIAFPIEQRVKSLDSIFDKCERNGSNPNCIGEIDDIAGIRIVLLFHHDENVICDLIEKTFKILEKENTIDRLSEDQFGYGSIHYLVETPNSWSKVPTLKKLKELHAEIQVRTASQHIWAAASHILQYKKKRDVPVPLRRSINRVAALLETVDLEFDRLLSDRMTYVDETIKDLEVIDLNSDTLRATLDELLPLKNKKENEPYAELLEDLTYFNIYDTVVLRRIIKKHLDKVLAIDKEIAKGLPKGVFYAHVGLVRTALEVEFGNKWTDYNNEKSKERTKGKELRRKRRVPSRGPD